MTAWKNMDTLAAYQDLMNAPKVDLAAAMSGENGAQRVRRYTVPMGAGLDFNFGARPVDDGILAILADFAREAGRLAHRQILNAINHRLIRPSSPGEKDMELIRQIFERSRRQTRDRFVRRHRADALAR